AANFADVPTRNQPTCPIRILLDRRAAKWNSYLGHGIHSDRQKQHQPTAIGEAMAHGLGLGPDKARRGQWICPRPSGLVQPRLAGAMCLTTNFGAACVFNTPMCLWWR